ncbi:MAG: hypothetical protein ACTJGV_14955, partial [Proteus vulgaris]
MKYFFYPFLLCITFNIFAANRIPANSFSVAYDCVYNDQVAPVTVIDTCQDVIIDGVIHESLLPSLASGYSDWSP